MFFYRKERKDFSQSSQRKILFFANFAPFAVKMKRKDYLWTTPYIPVVRYYTDNWGSYSEINRSMTPLLNLL